MNVEAFKIYAGLSGMALLAVITLLTSSWLSLPDHSVFGVPLILGVFSCAAGGIVASRVRINSRSK